MLPPTGLLLIDKPAGITSHDVVDRVRRIMGTRAVGHAGTLDPFATGLLILGVNKATKWLTGLVGLDKEYITTIELGATSDTFDPEGKIQPQTVKTIPTEDGVEAVLAQFRRTFEQKAPLHSAKKIQGKKLYELARAGTATEEMRPVKQVTIHELKKLEYAWPRLKIRVKSSSGTYIRTLADDIGRVLGVGGYAKELRRTKIGSYSVEQATILANLAKESPLLDILPKS